MAEVGSSYVETFRSCLSRAVGCGKPLFVDLTSVSFIDGRGFRAIGDAAHRAADAGLAVTVVAPSALVGRILLATAGDALDVVGN
jgi:anti-anti-sigma regulatory factor